MRYIANRSSGAQGTAIARALAGAGATVTFVTGPADVAPPEGVNTVQIETARQMQEAVMSALPADVAIFAAAVADWHVTTQSDSKIKKDANGTLPTLDLAENPDILATVSQLKEDRPNLVIGFAAETDAVIENATQTLARKGCDWIIANDVSPETGIMGGQENSVTVIRKDGAETWPRMSKDQVANRLVNAIAEVLSE